MKKMWLILTPGGFLVGRFAGPKRAAEKWCKNHHLAWKLEFEGWTKNGLTVAS
jgi:hypothetical protein